MSDDYPEVTDTGLVTAAVTLAAVPPPEADFAMVPAAVEAAVVPTTQMPDGWTLHKVAALVTDVAQNMYDMPYLLKHHKLTAEQYNYLRENEFFKRALEAEIITWRGANSIQKRLALEAAIAVENALPTVAARLSKATEPLGEVVSLLKVLSEIAGVIGAKAAAVPAGSGERIKISINLGGDVTERQATVAVGSTASLQSQPEGQSTDAALHALVRQT